MRSFTLAGVTIVILVALVASGRGMTESEALGNLAAAWGPVVGFTGSSYCGTTHVGCNVNGSVVSLYLGNLKINGTIPNVWEGLPELTHIYLYFNNLYGTIPPAMVTLPKLEYLDLSDNALDGSLPSAFSPSVKRIYLDHNFLNGTIPDAIPNLPALASLYLSSNFFSCPLPANFVAKMNALAASCRMQENHFSIDGGALCGVYQSQDACQFLPVIIPTLEYAEDVIASMTHHHGHVRVAPRRASFHGFNETTKTIYSDEFMAADVQGITEAITLTDVLTEVYFPDMTVANLLTDGRKGFRMPLTLSNGVNFTVEIELGSSYAPEAVKISFELNSPWPWKSPSSNLTLQAQLSLKAPHSVLDGRQFPELRSEIYICDYSFFVDCNSAAIHTLMTGFLQNDFTMESETKKAKHSASFPLVVVADGVERPFTIQIPSAALLPIGSEFAIIRRVNSGMSFPFAAYPDSAQMSTLNIGINLGRYTQTLIYDPTFQIQRLFDFGESTTSPTGGTPSDGVNGVAIGVGVSVAALFIAVGVIILVIVLRRRMRTTMRIKQINSTNLSATTGNQVLTIEASKLKMGQKTGDGMFGERWTATFLGQPILVKKLDVGLDTYAKDYIQYSSVDSHDNLVKGLGTSQQGKTTILVLQQKEENVVSLSSMLQTEKPSAEFQLQVLKAVVEAMRALHRTNQLHNNLAARNVLVNKATRVVKVTDVGFRRTNIDPMTTNYPQTRWLAPEALQGEKYSQQSDVWQFGILIWELFSGGKLPYEDKFVQSANLVGLAKAIVTENLRPKIPKSMPAQLATLAQSCWQIDPAARPTFASVAATLGGMNLEAGSSWKSARGNSVTNI